MHKIEKNQQRLILRQIFFNQSNSQVIIHVDNVIYQGEIVSYDEEEDSISLDRGKDISTLSLDHIDELYLVSNTHLNQD